MTSYTFKTPTEDVAPLGKQYPFTRFKLTRGLSIWKTGGVYYSGRNQNYNDIPGYTEFYLGGGTHTVTDAVRTALLAGDVGITSANFTAI